MILHRTWLTALTAAVFVALATFSAGPASAGGGKLDKLNARMAVIQKQINRAKDQVAKDVALRKFQGIQSRIAKLENAAASQRVRSKRAVVTPVTSYWSWPADHVIATEAGRKAKEGGMMPEQWDRLFGGPGPSGELKVKNYILAINRAKKAGNTALMNQKIQELRAYKLGVLQGHEEFGKRRKTYLIAQWDRLKDTSLTIDERVGEMRKHSDCRLRCTFRMSNDTLYMDDYPLTRGQGVTW